MRITLPNVWPFAKLPNGFGSHRYVYSPILFDSQELFVFYLPHNLPGSQLRETTTIVPRATGLRQWNGDAYDSYQLSFLAAGAASGTQMVEKG